MKLKLLNPKISRIYKLYRILKTSYDTPATSKRNYLNLWLRNSIIIPELVGLRISLHNGKKMHSFIIRNSMIGFTLGSFALTKKLGWKIHIKKKKKGKKKKK